ncbi:MAG TPA: hypothetical protein VKS79_03650 [Gemmataceae bacterium]|nr:hypothetical protein [Gemmataceae bacterium]
MSHRVAYPGRLQAVCSVICTLTALAAILAFPRRLPAQFTQEKLTEIVKKAVDNKTVPFQLPYFEASEGALKYKYWGVKRTGAEFEERKPLMYPTDLQFRVELLRAKKYLTPGRREGQLLTRTLTAEEFKVLEPYLKEIESIVKEQLALIAKHKGTPEELLDKLGELDGKADEKFADALAKLAKHWRLQEAQPLVEGAAAYPVEFETNPPGGEVFYLNLADYDQVVEDGKIDKKECWFAAGKSREMNVGDYQFRAYLPNGKTETRKMTIAKPRNPNEAIKVIVPGKN